MLTLLLVLATILFAHALRLRPVDALYFILATALGNNNLQEAPASLKLLGCLVMLTGGALLAVLFSHLTSVVMAERLEQQMGRRAQRLSGHVVVAGLGNVGYRVSRLLCDLVEEYGRHTGHADLLREAVDGLVGEDPPPGWRP